MEKFNFFRKSKDKIKGAVVGASLVMGALGAQAQEEIKTPYDTMPNPITATIDLDEINYFQETYPLEVNKNQAEWGAVNRDYYLSGFKLAQQANFNSAEFSERMRKTSVPK